MKPKKIPMRLCLGCGEMKPKRELIRVVKAPDGEISLDTTGKKIRQRGVYLPGSRMPGKGAEGKATGEILLLPGGRRCV